MAGLRDVLITLIWTCVVFALAVGCEPARAPAATVTVVPPATTPPPSPTPTPMPMVEGTTVSPDGRWVAYRLASAPAVSGTVVPGEIGQEFYHALLVVSRADGAVRWTVVDEQRPYGLGWTSPQVVRWSRDGRYLFYTDYPVPDGCAPYVDGWGLYRVDLQDGHIETIIAQAGLVQSLSPDDRTLLYLDGVDPTRIVRRDVATGVEARADLPLQPGWAAGHILWSPDGSAAVLEINTAPCDPEHAKLSVVRVDAGTLAVKVLVDQDARLPSPVEWRDATTVVVQDRDGRRWLLDAATGELREGPPS